MRCGASRLSVFVFSGLILALLLAACGSPDADSADPFAPPPDSPAEGVALEPDLSKLSFALSAIARGEFSLVEGECPFERDLSAPGATVNPIASMLEEDVVAFETSLNALGGRVTGEGRRGGGQVELSVRVPVAQLAPLAGVPELIRAYEASCDFPPTEPND